MSPSRRRISVALCTYNGSRHVPEQLRTIAEQSRLPDELVAFDDASTDGTAAILRDFAARAPFPVRVQVNPNTLGPARNFQQAIAACDGDIIALCDQDDIWRADKLALTEAAFANNPDLGFVCADADVCDEDGRPLGYRLWDSVRFGASLRRRAERGGMLAVLLRKNVVTGATMALAGRLRPLLLPIDPLWMHDGWIALLLSAVAPVALIHQPVMRYRQHPRQSVGALQRTLYQEYLAAKKMDRDFCLKDAQMYQAGLDGLLQFQLQPNSGICPSPAALDLLRGKIRHCRRRSAIRRGECARLLPSLIELAALRYRRFSLGWKSFAQDLFL